MIDEFIGTVKDNLKVLYYTNTRLHSHKLYAVQCSICAKDTELHGSAIYFITKHEFNRGRVPCGCSKSPRWTKEQTIVRINRFCSDKKYTFCKFVGDWSGSCAKLLMYCEIHGTYWTPVFPNLQRSKGCHKCKAEKISESQKKNDDVMIASFLANNTFHKDTLFWRSDKVNSKGHKPYWYVKCPMCPDVYECRVGDLGNGYRPCNCPVHGFDKSKDANLYVLEVVDEDGNPVFTGYGISNIINERVRSHTKLLKENKLIIKNKELFSVSGKVAFEIESQIKNNFKLFRQNISGFKREATFPENYRDVVDFIRDKLSNK